MPLGSCPIGSAPLSAPESSAYTHVPLWFCTTGVGTPSSSFAQVGAASGVAPTTSFGIPAGDFSTRHIVSGIASRNATGTPFSIYPQIGVSSGFRRWTFGTPARVISNYAPSSSQGAKFGSPKGVVINRTAQSVGFGSTHLGTPARSGGIPTSAQGFSSTYVGTPSSKYTQFGTAGVSTGTIFGTPRRPLDQSLDNVFVRQRTLRIDVWTEA